MRLPHPLYGLYERRLAASLHPDRVPRHIGVILDGNRRWARGSGLSSATGHRRGADKISDVLQWSEDVGVEVVTLWMLSTDNLARDPEELEPLLHVIEDVVGELAAERRWRVQAVGALDMLPDRTASALKAAQDSTDDVQGLHVNVAVGYGGAARSPTRCARSCGCTPRPVRASTSSPRRSTSSTSPSTCTPRVSRTRTS